MFRTRSSATCNWFGAAIPRYAEVVREARSGERRRLSSALGIVKTKPIH
jgi:hypothetical protein